MYGDYLDENPRFMDLNSERMAAKWLLMIVKMELTRGFS